MLEGGKVCESSGFLVGKFFPEDFFYLLFRHPHTFLHETVPAFAGRAEPPRKLFFRSYCAAASRGYCEMFRKAGEVL